MVPNLFDTFRGTFGNHGDIDSLYHIEPLERTNNGVRIRSGVVSIQLVNTLFRLNKHILCLLHQSCQLKGEMKLVVG